MNEIQLDFISNNKFENMKMMEKIRYIIDEVKKEKIIVLEYGLSPVEETKLIEMTMMEISDTFLGIEIESYPREKTKITFFSKLFYKKYLNKLTIIGPANKLKTLKKDNNLISTIVSIKRD